MTWSLRGTELQIRVKLGPHTHDTWTGTLAWIGSNDVTYGSITETSYPGYTLSLTLERQ